MDIQHKENPRGGLFYLGAEDEPTAELAYRLAGPHRMIIDHTEVSDIHKGEGIGKLLVERAVEYARERGMTIKPLCVFAKSIIDRTPAYQDLLAHD